MTSRGRKQEGAALITAIFLLVVLATLGAYMVSIGGTQDTAATKSLQAARAYFGARAGVEWAIHRAINDPTAICSSTSVTATSFTFTDNGLRDVSVAVNCSYSTHDENVVAGTTNPFNVYYITSTAAYGASGSVDYAQRRLETTVTNRFRQ